MSTGNTKRHVVRHGTKTLCGIVAVFDRDLPWEMSHLLTDDDCQRCATSLTAIDREKYRRYRQRPHAFDRSAVGGKKRRHRR